MNNDIKISRELAERIANPDGIFPGFRDKNVSAHVDAIKELRALLTAPVVERQEAWMYCPECGCEELRHEEGEHKQCTNCYQEWFSDIDYSEVVRGNLEKLKALPPAPVAVQLDENVEFEKWWCRTPFLRKGKLQIAQEAWQARACLDKVKELNQ